MNDLLACLSHSSERETSSSASNSQPSRPPYLAVFLFSLVVRIGVLAFGTIVYCIFPSYDTSRSLLFSERGIGPSNILVRAFSPWDAIWFLGGSDSLYGISGQVHEANFAFFPLVGLLARLLGPTIALLLSNLLYCLGGLALVRLGCEMGFSPRLSAVSGVLWALGPASVFGSALYSESWFAFFSFSGMLMWRKSCLGKPPSFVLKLAAAVAFSIAGFSRSNAIVLGGFFVFDALKERSFVSVLRMGLLCALIAVPFVLFQWHAYFLFCVSDDPHFVRGKWCDRSPPSVYSYVQKEYWGNGLFAYWEFKQIPNFVLALPMFAVVCGAAVEYFGNGRTRQRIVSSLLGKDDPKSGFSDYSGSNLFPFVVYTIVMTILCVLWMNVQVLTRFLSSHPLIYWYLGNTWDRRPRTRRWMVIYFIGYTIIGTTLFCTFYPWT